MSELQHTLRGLHEELHRAQRLDPEDRAMLETLLDDIRRVLETPAEQPAAGERGDALEGAAVRLEAGTPRRGERAQGSHRRAGQGRHLIATITALFQKVFRPDFSERLPVRSGIIRSRFKGRAPADPHPMQQDSHPFDEAFGKAVDLGNQIADNDDKADVWDIADGLLAGAVQYWLYTRQPCGDPRCEECLPISTAEGRLEELRRLLKEFSEESQYFHSPTDSNVGRA